jgi:septum formation protein
MRMSVKMDCNCNLVLASGSPRRRELLAAAGYTFRVVVPDESIEAQIEGSLEPAAYVVEASFRKAQSVATCLNDEVVIAADTVAVMDGIIIGKPRDVDHARQILSAMRGRLHLVLTGITVWNCQTNQHTSHVETTQLQMAPISDSDLQRYLESGQWEGKAGAFGYQDDNDWLLILKGLETNVVGLPIERLPVLLERVTRPTQSDSMNC